MEAGVLVGVEATELLVGDAATPGRAAKAPSKQTKI